MSYSIAMGHFDLQADDNTIATKNFTVVGTEHIFIPICRLQQRSSAILHIDTRKLKLVIVRYLAVATVVASTIAIWFFVATPEKRLVSSNLLDRPIRIMVNESPLNSEAKKMFPSPAIYDVDGDGSEDLIIGDLMGGVGVYANLNTSGAGDPIWSSRTDINDSKGNLIETANW